MLVLASADLHGNYEIYEWLVGVSRAEQPGVVVLAGDLFGFPDGYSSIEEAQLADASRILKILEGIRAPILYIMGNGDMID